MLSLKWENFNTESICWVILGQDAQYISAVALYFLGIEIIILTALK